MFFSMYIYAHTNTCSSIFPRETREIEQFSRILCKRPCRAGHLKGPDQVLSELKCLGTGLGQLRGDGKVRVPNFGYSSPRSAEFCTPALLGVMGAAEGKVGGGDGKGGSTKFNVSYGTHFQKKELLFKVLEIVGTGLKSPIKSK